MPAELATNVQLASEGEEEEEPLYIPPPLLPAKLPVNVLLISVGEEEDVLYIPPPLLPAELPVNVQLVSVREGKRPL